jgi:DNA-binding beta-propeller fold protein YncE
LTGNNLYVADYGNNRVLFFPFGSTSATRVYGQQGLFNSSTPNNGGVTANSLNQPTGLALDSLGNLYICDSSNNRVLLFYNGNTTATRVYGQPNFISNTANNGGIGPARLNLPYDVTLDRADNLYIADLLNARILFFLNGTNIASRGRPFCFLCFVNTKVLAQCMGSSVSHHPHQGCQRRV